MVLQIRSGIQSSLRSTVAFSPLRRSITTAIQNSDIARLKHRLALDPKSIREKMCDDTIPLHYLAGACPYNGLRLPIEKEPDAKFTKVFLSRLKKEDIDQMNNYGETALTIAARVGYSNVVHQLLQRGANPDGNPKSKRGSPLHANLMSTVMFDPSFKVAELLLKFGADIHVRDRDGLNPLFALVHSIEPMEEGAIKSMNSLYSDTTRIAIYHYRNLYQKMSFLFDNGAKVRDAEGDMDLFDICLEKLDPYASGRTIDRYIRPLIPLVLKNYALPFCPNPSLQWTFLHTAVFKQCHEAVERLLKDGYRVDKPCKKGITPLDLAIFNQDREMLFALRKPDQTLNVPPSFFGDVVKKLRNYQFFDKHSDKMQFTTGLPGIAHAYTSSNNNMLALYHVTSEYAECPISLSKRPVLLSPMAKALYKKDLKQALELIEKGWNAHIDHDFVSDTILKSSGDTVIGFREAFYKYFSKENAEFYKLLLIALNQSTSSGITLSHEFENVLLELGNTTTEDMAFTFFEAGLTPEIYFQQTGRNFENEMSKSYHNSFNTERGWSEYRDYKGMCKVLQETNRRGWTKKEQE